MCNFFSLVFGDSLHLIVLLTEVRQLEVILIKMNTHSNILTQGSPPGNSVQSWPKKFVLGCVISPLRQEAESRNLGQTFLAISVGPFDAGPRPNSWNRLHEQKSASFIRHLTH